LGAWAKSSNSLALNLWPRMTAIESTQASLDAKVSTLQKDTSDIKTMLTKIYQAFKGSSALVDPLTLALTMAPAIVEWERVTEAPSTRVPESSTSQPTATDVASRGQPPSHTKGEIPIVAVPISSFKEPEM
jgi:hypothetical protein